MTRILAVLLWPAGLAVMAGIAIFMSKRRANPLPNHAGVAHRFPANSGSTSAKRIPHARTQALDAARWVLIAVPAAGHAPVDAPPGGTAAWDQAREGSPA